MTKRKRPKPTSLRPLRDWGSGGGDDYALHMLLAFVVFLLALAKLGT